MVDKLVTVVGKLTNLSGKIPQLLDYQIQSIIWKKNRILCDEFMRSKLYDIIQKMKLIEKHFKLINVLLIMVID